MAESVSEHCNPCQRDCWAQVAALHQSSGWTTSKRRCFSIHPSGGDSLTGATCKDLFLAKSLAKTRANACASSMKAACQKQCWCIVLQANKAARSNRSDAINSSTYWDAQQQGWWSLQNRNTTPVHSHSNACPASSLTDSKNRRAHPQTIFHAS